MTRILFMISRRDKPSSRLRVLQYVPFLQKEGFVCCVIELRKNPLRRIMAVLCSFRSDIVFIQKKVLTGVEIALLGASGAKIVYDIDDAVSYRETGRWAVKVTRTSQRLSRMLRSTDMVIAGNSFLRDMTARDGLRVELLPTPCPAETCRRNPGPGGSIGRKLVWIGSRSTLKYLQMLVGVFRRLSGLFPDLQLMVISDSFEDVEGIRTQFIRWTEATEYGSLVQGDIGLMPLYDNDWCRGKCGYKIIQYMACGIPAVASPVGFNAQLIRDGENGFLADSEEDWVRKISLLLEDKKAYMDMSLKARRTFEEGYRVEPSAKKLSGYLRSLTGRAPA